MWPFCVSGQYDKAECGAAVLGQSQLYTWQNGGVGSTGVTDCIEQRQMEVHDGLRYEKGTGDVSSTGVISQTIFFLTIFCCAGAWSAGAALSSSLCV